MIENLQPYGPMENSEETKKLEEHGRNTAKSGYAVFLELMFFRSFLKKLRSSQTV